MAQSLAHLFIDRVAKSGSAVAVRYKESRGPFRDMTWSEFGDLVTTMAFGLVSLGLAPRAAAALMAPTSYQWAAADLSIILAGGFSTPIYPTSSSSDIAHILNNSQAEIVFVHNEHLLKRVLSVKAQIPKLRSIILLTAPTKGQSLADLPESGSLVMGLEELLELGRECRNSRPSVVNERVASTAPGDLATVIYTSGTTGTPKGVMLCHSTILAVLDDLPDLIPVTESDLYLSFLPLSHVFERVCGEFFWIQNGAATAFAEGIEHVAKNMQEVSPTVMLVVPRILDKIYAKVMAGIAGASGRARKLIEWSLAVAIEMERHKNESTPPRRMLEAKYWLAKKLVLSKLKDRIGSRLRMIVSGGAPATPEVIEFFNAIGICVVEGYGLTETAAPTNVNRLNKNKYGTVGPKLPCVELAIAEDGEIMFRGPSIFKGYYRDEELTREVFSEDGWFHTGDIGEVDADGYLKITDRKKDIIVNSSGKNIAPQRIENILKLIPLVSQAVVFGDKRKTLVALLTLEEQPTVEFAREAGWTFREFRELLQLPELKAHLQKCINEKCAPLADYERVRNFAILTSDLSVESGELTATLKIKRNVIKTRYASLIESLYKEEKLVGTR